jgi:dTDP-4-amino-4,6-dideoxygalactose transaminase
MIPVTKSFIPTPDEYQKQVNRAFENVWLTNRGPLVLELEKKLKRYLTLQDSSIICTNNGTIPIQIALKLLA